MQTIDVPTFDWLPEIMTEAESDAQARRVLTIIEPTVDGHIRVRAVTMKAGKLQLKYTKYCYHVPVG